MEKQMDRVFYFNNGKKNPPIYGIKDGRYFFLRLDKTWEIRWTLEDFFMEEKDKLVEIPESSELYRPFDPSEYEWKYAAFENFEIRYNVEEDLYFIRCKNGEPTRSNPNCVDDNWDLNYIAKDLQEYMICIYHMGPAELTSLEERSA